MVEYEYAVENSQVYNRVMSKVRKEGEDWGFREQGIYSGQLVLLGFWGGVAGLLQRPLAVRLQFLLNYSSTEGQGRTCSV